MFGKKQEKTVTVSNSRELKEAVKRKEKNIEVTGNLARKLSWMAKVSPKKITAIIGVLAVSGITGPLTGGASVAAVLPSMAVVVGKDLAIVILASSVSASLIIALFKGYDIKLGIGGNIFCCAKH